MACCLPIGVFRQLGWTCLLATVMAAAAQAGTAFATFEVYHLPLNEAVRLVKSQLSPDGKVTVLASRRLLVVQDDEAHIKQAGSMLKRLDQSLPVYKLQLEILETGASSQTGAGITQIRLPGGWVRLRLNATASDSRSSRLFDLRAMAGDQARIETGLIVPVQSSVRRWLEGLGVWQDTTVTMTPVTSGFAVIAQPLPNQRVRLRLHPWLRRMAQSGQTIDITEAETEIIMNLEEDVTIAATGQEAKNFTRALLGYDDAANSGDIQFRFRVSLPR